MSSSSAHHRGAAARGASGRNNNTNRCIVGLRWSTLLIAVSLAVMLYLRMFVLPGLLAPPDEQVINGRTVTRRHPDQLYKVHNNTKLPT